ncbi:MAG: UvrD-helicase domain-containing protein [Anaerolineaceae bacterium]|nr:UvrD-helicase domain-containing protein [Anaerolineaceae bacterium]
MDFLNDLNSQQRQAVTAAPGQTLVLAGPGSGKTRVLTNRIAYLVQAMGVRPYHILAVTFTNKAAREMQTRLERLFGATLDGIWLGTFHAACARILRREADYLPVSSSFVIMDADDQETLVKRALKELNISDKLYRPSSVHAAISNAKNNLTLPENFPTRNYRDEVIVRLYERYQQLLQASNGVDFDDLLLMTVNLLENHPEVKERYARRFEHVLVDEFQDTNVAQYQLLGQLSSYHHNLYAVGDEDQSIYRWRGADYRNVLRFAEDFPGCQKILLEQNYRSTQTVLDAARAVIDRNPYRTPKNLRSDRGPGNPILSYEAVDDHAEAAYVVDTIQQLVSGGKCKGSDFAVMYRTNAQSRLLEEAFLRSGLPYRLVGAQRFYGRREIKDMISFLRLVHNPADEVSLMRVINVPPRGIGDKTLVALQLAARQAGAGPGEVLIDLGRQGDQSPYWKSFSGRGATVLVDFGAMLSDWREGSQALTLPALFDRILNDTVYQAYLDDGSEEGQGRWENVQELRKLAYEYQDRGLTEFLENLALVSDQDTLPEQTDAPTLLTLHAAKGLEFSHVFIIGLDEGLIPHSRSIDDPEEMAEERRLFYVGLTRARNQLYLVRAGQRSTYGSYEVSEPSRFLSDIPEELVHTQGNRSHGRRSTSAWQDATRWQTRSAPPAMKSAPVVERRFPPGSRVNHPTWGEGMVVDSRIQDEEETVDVFFDSVGFKRLLASAAKLERIRK